jgi:hypothetical protein
MVYNQFIFVIDGKLYVVTDINTLSGFHRATIRVCQRELCVFTLA